MKDDDYYLGIFLFINETIKRHKHNKTYNKINKTTLLYWNPMYGAKRVDDFHDNKSSLSFMTYE